MGPRHLGVLIRLVHAVKLTGMGLQLVRDAARALHDSVDNLWATRARGPSTGVGPGPGAGPGPPAQRARGQGACFVFWLWFWL